MEYCDYCKRETEHYAYNDSNEVKCCDCGFSYESLSDRQELIIKTFFLDSIPDSLEMAIRLINILQEKNILDL